MNKKLITALVTAITLTMTACGNNNSQTPETPTADVTAQPSEEVSGNMSGVSEDTAAETVGTMLLTRFETLSTENPDLSALELATKLTEDERIPFDADAASVEEGLLTGFGNYEVTGFQEGAVFGPIIGTIPFIGYVFTLEENADMDAFLQNLAENGNLRWNVCTEADDMITGKAGNKAFFLMCPRSFEEDSDVMEDYDNTADDMMDVPAVYDDGMSSPATDTDTIVITQ